MIVEFILPKVTQYLFLDPGRLIRTGTNIKVSEDAFHFEPDWPEFLSNGDDLKLYSVTSEDMNSEMGTLVRSAGP